MEVKLNLDDVVVYLLSHNALLIAKTTVLETTLYALMKRQEPGIDIEDLKRTASTLIAREAQRLILTVPGVDEALAKKIQDELLKDL